MIPERPRADIGLLCLLIASLVSLAMWFGIYSIGRAIWAWVT